MATMDLHGRIHPGDEDPTPNIPYDEDVLVSLITEIYKTILRLRPAEEAFVVWPPPGGHQLDLSAIPPGDIVHPRLVSLMKRLPVYKSCRECVVPSMTAVDFLRSEGMRQSRLVNLRNYDLPDDQFVLAPPTAMVLLTGWHDLTPILVLDISDNTVRWVGDTENLEDDYTKAEKDPEKVANWCYDYTNWPEMPAPVYFERVLQNYLEAAWIPNSVGSVWTLDEPVMAERQRLLKEEYGWPSNFREGAWKEKAEDLMQEDIDKIEEERETVRALLAARVVKTS
ncbi:hypothetical protein PRZ48_010077 [Zasmidium cellare]|uniref:Uncharacterized protein n=1 Tax=Zasmidium cellare TaxID=395010 RepID=A0ABR0EEJ4_ZASCE|nr:hypothetical protein PRZ48_010077 [Zasmidium cellare]